MAAAPLLRTLLRTPVPTEILTRRLLSRTKNQPKEEVFGTDVPRTSGGHSRGYPGPKLWSAGSKSWKNKHFGADIHDPKARTSTTLRGFQKLRSEKLWAEFSLPILRTLLRSTSFLRTLLRSVLLHDPLGVRPIEGANWACPGNFRRCPQYC